MINRRIGALLALALVGGVVLFAAAASSARTDTAASSARTSGVPSWCGPKKITLGLTDGFGGNSWRLVTTASARNEAAKCPSVTSVSYADGQGNTQKALSDIQRMDAKGINAIVVDVRCLVPLDTRTILGEVSKTGRLFTVEENPRLCGWGAEIASIVAEECFDDLDGPIVRITTPHVPLPAAQSMEDEAMPTVARIVDTVKGAMR